MHSAEGMLAGSRRRALFVLLGTFCEKLLITDHSFFPKRGCKLVCSVSLCLKIRDVCKTAQVFLPFISSNACFCQRFTEFLFVFNKL